MPLSLFFFFFFQAEDGIRDSSVTGVQTCALPISAPTGLKPVRAGRRRRSRQERLAYTILLPALGTLFVIVTIPFVLAICQSIPNDDGTLVGMPNYTRPRGNPALYDALPATPLYAAT